MNTSHLTRLPRLLPLVLALGLPVQAAPDIDTRPVPAAPRASTLPADWQHGVFM